MPQEDGASGTSAELGSALVAGVEAPAPHAPGEKAAPEAGTAAGAPAPADGTRREQRLELRVQALRQSVRELRREKRELAQALARATAQAEATEQAVQRLQARVNLLVQARRTTRPGERVRLLMTALFATWREQPPADGGKEGEESRA